MQVLRILIMVVLVCRLNWSYSAIVMSIMQSSEHEKARKLQASLEGQPDQINVVSRTPSPRTPGRPDSKASACTLEWLCWGIAFEW